MAKIGLIDVDVAGKSLKKIHSFSKSHPESLSGMRFGRLLAIKKTRENYKSDYWLCKCDCGAEKEIRCDALLNGRTKSCGCFLRESAKERATKHGLNKSKIYGVFYAMHHRCENTKDVAYKYYGGRGISVCDEWSYGGGFEKFYKWAVENGYKEGLTIDRINTDGNYEPKNCKWATRKEQQQNLRRNVKVLCDGETMTLAQASEKYGIPARTIYIRIKQGWNDDDAVKTEINSKYINRRTL